MPARVSTTIQRNNQVPFFLSFIQSAVFFWRLTFLIYQEISASCLTESWRSMKTASTVWWMNKKNIWKAMMRSSLRLDPGQTIRSSRILKDRVSNTARSVIPWKQEMPKRRSLKRRNWHWNSRADRQGCLNVSNLIRHDPKSLDRISPFTVMTAVFFQVCRKEDE